MNAADTNILLYARDPRDQNKEQTASGLIQTPPDPVLLWQVACEYVAASRKLRSAGHGPDRAWDDVARLSKLRPLRLPSDRILSEARLLNQSRSLSVWDALLIAACVEANVTTLFTEDLQHGAMLNGVEVVNPVV
ncbi:MAG TPA: PIN domain-containing protein [Bryobacteraceae bacterium]|nr:PIN domain-containing protein [Bryobacteraceae bacterium]